MALRRGTAGAEEVEGALREIVLRDTDEAWRGWGERMIAMSW